MHKELNMTVTGRKLHTAITRHLYFQIQRTGVQIKGCTTREIEQQLRDNGRHKLATEMMRQLRIELNHAQG